MAHVSAEIMPRLHRDRTEITAEITAEIAPRSRRDRAEITPRSARRYKLHIGVACAAVQLGAIAGLFGAYYRENSPQAAISATSRRDLGEISACTTVMIDTCPRELIHLIPRGRSCTTEESYTLACFSRPSRRRCDMASGGIMRT